MNTVTPEVCPSCDVAVEVTHERRDVPLGPRRVAIDDEFMRCPSCSETFYTLEQAGQRHGRAVAQARLEDRLLTPDQIREIRETLGLSRPQFERLLGVGEKTCIRWEKGTVCQNTATDRLIRLLAANRANASVLAGINGLTLPDSCYVPDALHQHRGERGASFFLPTFAARPSAKMRIAGTLEKDEQVQEHSDMYAQANAFVSLLRVGERAAVFRTPHVGPLLRAKS